MLKKIGCHVGPVLRCSAPSFNTCLLSPETTDPCLSRASYSRGFIKVRVFRSTVYLTIPTLFCASAGATGRCDVATPASCQLSSHVSGGCSTRQLRCCNNYPVSTPADYLHSLSSVVTGHRNKNFSYVLRKYALTATTFAPPAHVRDLTPPPRLSPLPRVDARTSRLSPVGA